MKNKVKAFYNPPSLLFRQLVSTLLMGYLNRGRALAYSGDYLAEDPRCFIREKK